VDWNIGNKGDQLQYNCPLSEEVIYSIDFLDIHYEYIENSLFNLKEMKNLNDIFAISQKSKKIESVFNNTLEKFNGKINKRNTLFKTFIISNADLQNPY
jgi:hypothetical protein